jgi:antirestriction protein ArdC
MDLYESITNRIIAQLEAGTVPWRKPWKSSGGLPRNLISKKPYRGVNLLLLGMFNHENPFYLTYRQAQLFGGHVRQGEHGVPIVYWNISKKETTDEQGGVEEERFAFLKHYTVFHVSQCELPPELLPVMLKVDPPNRFFPAETCEQIVATEGRYNAPPAWV